MLIKTAINMKPTFCTLALLLIPTFLSASDVQPNVILIMADDLGYNDLSCYGSQEIDTPVLDQLATEGVRLTSFYSGCTICTPSRMALLTGMYPIRCGWQGGVVGYGIQPQNGLSPQTTTIAEIYKTAGYTTALIGKWHLGDTSEHSPMVHGFDSAFFIDKSNNQTKKLWRGETIVADPFDNRRLTENFTSEAISFIEANRDTPFFLYMPLSAPHFPAQAHPDWKDRTNLGAYGDVVEELDGRIGMLLYTLTQLEIDDRTIIVFLSDNGVEPGQKQWAQSAPYRGLKWSTLEGGNRVPCIIRWPGRIPAGTVNNQLTAAIDLLPTLVSACRIDSPVLHTVLADCDGVNVLDSLIKKRNRRHARNSLLFWHGWGTPQAIRVDQWKLFFDQVKELPDSQNGPVLINLENDPAEMTNLSKQYPQRVAKMLATARQKLKYMEDNATPLGGPKNPQAKVPAMPKWLD